MSNGNTYVDSWSKKLGLLPISLFQQKKRQLNQFILLNGQTNNFCIDWDTSMEPSDYKSYAWSAGVDNFLSVKDEKVYLYRWYKSSVETIDVGIVDNNIVKFYDYLSKTKGNKENSIVSYTLRTFYKLRNLLKNEKGEQALQAFLYLLANLNTQNVILSDWGLTPESAAVVNTINQDDWINLLSEFQSGMLQDELIPNTNLILRHTAGRLFEEAHFAAFINKQLTFFGPPEDISFKSKTPQQYGAYFTPSYIARSIVEEVLNSYDPLPASLTIFDPACGSSEFLIETLRQLKRLNYSGKLKIIGWDDSRIAIDVSTFILTYELKEWSGKVTFELKKTNSLVESNQWPKDVDILLMNPPFRSWELMSSESELRDQVKSILGQQYSKNPNQASAFFKLAVESLKEDGRLGCLLPSALFASDSHQVLRSWAAEQLSPLIIGRLGSFVFDNALVDACMFIAKKSRDQSSARIIWTKNVADVTSKALRELRKTHFSPGKIVNEPDLYSIYESNNSLSSASSWMPVSYDAANLIFQTTAAVKSKKLSLIKDVFSVHRGADPGRKYFKISQSVYNSFSKKEKEYFRPCIESRNIRNGHLDILNYLFFPKTEGLLPLNTESDLRAHVPSFYSKFLLPNKEELKSRGKIDKAKWWNLQWHRPWQEKKLPKLVSAAFGKAGDFALDESGEFVVEQSCAWFTKNENVSIEILYAYLSIFCSELFNTLLKTYAKQLAGGEWFNLQTKHVNNIPVPDLINEKSYNNLVKQLSEFGRKLTKGEPIDKEKNNQLVIQLYNF